MKQHKVIKNHSRTRTAKPGTIAKLSRKLFELEMRYDIQKSFIAVIRYVIKILKAAIKGNKTRKLVSA